MRKVILYFHMSLDNVISDVENWMQMSDEMLHSSIELYKMVDTAIFGSNTAGDIAKYWKNAEEKPTTPVEQEYAIQINNIKKYVVSRSADLKIDWNNTELLHFDDLDGFKHTITRMKAQEGKDISVESGLAIWKLFLENDLFDEIFVTVHPAIAGKGEKIFADDLKLYKLHLKDKRFFSNGAIEMHYEKQ